MRRILICSGVPGGGTVLVFGAAALTAVLVDDGSRMRVGPSVELPAPEALR